MMSEDPACSQSMRSARCAAPLSSDPDSTPIANYNIAAQFDHIATKQPRHSALIVRRGKTDQHCSFQQLQECVHGFAHDLVDRGINRGDRVILMVGPSVEFVALSFALFAIGAVVILIDPGMGFANLRRCIGQVQPKIFIGSLKAHLFKFLCPAPFAGVTASIIVSSGVGPFIGCFGRSLSAAKVVASPFARHRPFSPVACGPADAAAIIFTTGSTGPPKGVCYEHGVFQAQLQLVREYYGITPNDVDQPAFPLFALFSTALGATAVLPDMDPAHPARVKPEKFVRTIVDHKVTYSFGSPAIWQKVSRYCLQHGITLPSLRKVLMAGAPVPGDLVARVQRIIAPDGDIHTPYGATESLPIASISGREILGQTWAATEEGRGVCVGRPLPGIDIRVICLDDAAIPVWDEALLLPTNEIGEIVVRGPVVTRRYDHNDRDNQLSKITDNGRFWHRVGDAGYLDEQGRLWFCGRKAHRVRTPVGTLFTICCEAIFNQHADVCRTALVGIGEPDQQIPVLIAEPLGKPADPRQLLQELRDRGARHPLTAEINSFLLHPSFPVDIRHNAKIFREKLAIWAAKQLRLPAAGDTEQ